MKKTIIKVVCFIKEQPIVRVLRIWRARKKMLNTKKLDWLIKQHRGEMDAESKSRLKEDMLLTAKQSHFTFDEYLCYRFDERNQSERAEFLSHEAKTIFCEKINKSYNLALFEDKSETAAIFGKYYRRDVCCVMSRRDLGKLKAFSSKHRRFIVKPINDSCGNGIKIVDLQQYDDCLLLFEDLVKEYCKGLINGFIAEQLIVQSSEIGQFHPSSVNTLRVTTLRIDDEVEIIHPFLKIGQGGKVVDNGGQGGLLCLIEPTEGVITNVADEFGKRYTVHPDTGLPIVGFKIPRWKEALNLAKELSGIIPKNKYTGWDFALTDEGWIMVEGNARGQFIGWQLTSQIGFRREANMFLKRMNMKEL